MRERERERERERRERERESECHANIAHSFGLTAILGGWGHSQAFILVK